MSENKAKKLFSSMTNISDDIIEEAQTYNTHKKSYIRVKWAVVAACLCIALAVGAFSNIPNSTNTFVVKAYALDETDDGIIKLAEVDLINQPDMWGGYFDGDNFYINIGLRYEGNNIESVDFITEEGFFAKQYIDRLANGENVGKLYVGADNRLVVYGREFDVVGNIITLNDETMTDDLLLFWGTPMEEMSEIPQNIKISAVATFNDERTQEITISVDLSGPGVYSAVTSEEELQREREEADYYDNLPLEECELVEGSVETVTESYLIKLGTGTYAVEIFDNMPFDENGIHRAGTIVEGFEIYIPVIKRDANGVYTGMLYRVPHDLHYNPE